MGLELDKKLLGSSTNMKKEEVKIEPSEGGGADTVQGSNPEGANVSETVEKPASKGENQDPNISTTQEEVTACTKAPFDAQKTPKKISTKKNKKKRKAPCEIKCKDCGDAFSSKQIMTLHTCHSILDKRMRIENEMRGRERRSTSRF